MNDNIKQLILKILLVLVMILMVATFPGGILFAFLISDVETLGTVVYTCFFGAFGVFILFMILLLIFGGLKRKPVKADKYPLAITSYSELLEFLQERLLQKNYKFQKTLSISSNGTVSLYLKPKKTWELACFTIIRVSELSDDLITEANDSITEILTEYYGGETITDSIDMISVFCVDRITPAFQKLVNTNLQQGLKNGRFIAGVSFGVNNVYLAKQEDGFFMIGYKQLRNEFIDIMELKDVKK